MPSERRANRKIRRCPWCEGNDLYIKYHDEEWGVPAHDEKKHFEFLTLETAQAGLSWLTILKRRHAYRKAYSNFDPRKVARYGSMEVESLLHNPGIIRNRRKIEASINNAGRFLEVQKEMGSFDHYIWSFVSFRPVVNRWRTLSEVPSRTALSDRVRKDLIGRGFRFIGSTIIYAHLQAIGIINDHLITCFRYREIREIFS